MSQLTQKKISDLKKQLTKNLSVDLFGALSLPADSAVDETQHPYTDETSETSSYVKNFINPKEE